MPGAARRRRLLLLGLAQFIAGLASGTASLHTRTGGLMSASWWLTRCSYGCLAVAVTCAALLWRSR
jgi:hypothetical protein